MGVKTRPQLPTFHYPIPSPIPCPRVCGDPSLSLPCPRVCGDPSPLPPPTTPPRRGGSRTARPQRTPHVILSSARPHMSFRAQRTPHVILNVAKRSEESIAPHNQPRLSLPVSSRMRGPTPLPPRVLAKAGTHPSPSPTTPPRRGGSRTARPQRAPHVILSSAHPTCHSERSEAK